MFGGAGGIPEESLLEVPGGGVRIGGEGWAVDIVEGNTEALSPGLEGKLPV